MLKVKFNNHAVNVAIVEVFDSLTSRRPYKPPWPIDKTLENIRNSAGNHLDPELVQLFLERTVEVQHILELFIIIAKQARFSFDLTYPASVPIISNEPGEYSYKNTLYRKYKFSTQCNPSNQVS